METLRLDKWLFAARFYKSRSLASGAVSGGKVHLAGKRTKPSHRVSPGDILEIRRGQEKYTVIVRQLSDKRGPASAARQLYEETATSLAERESKRREERTLTRCAPHPVRRPNKQERRQIIHFTRKRD